ncbi:DUF3817 domain-containing protein [Murinocardiopsis flavida]|uniref:DUF3817 domain-containing protein n=1 Tax=Murinocardiopsis flavida TaxID=645275 RepID=UPI000D0CEC07|nr:DUF3817 domain-containing protein [Murinocardiopsis flavida]
MQNKRLPLSLYRVLAYVTGVWLLLLMFVAMPAKYLVGDDAMFSVVAAPAGAEHWFGPESPLMLYIAVPHGYIYMAYVLVVLWLAIGRRWSAGRTVGVALAGTIPLLGFFVERKVARREQDAMDAADAQSAPARTAG